MCKHSVYIIQKEISEPRFNKVFKPGNRILAMQIEANYPLLWLNRGTIENPSSDFSEWFLFHEDCPNCKRK